MKIQRIDRCCVEKESSRTWHVLSLSGDQWSRLCCEQNEFDQMLIVTHSTPYISYIILQSRTQMNKDKAKRSYSSAHFFFLKAGYLKDMMTKTLFFLCLAVIWRILIASLIEDTVYREEGSTQRNIWRNLYVVIGISHQYIDFQGVTHCEL